MWYNTYKELINMRKSPTFNKTIICSRCSKPFPPTGNRQLYCPDCKVIVTKETKRRHYMKTNPNAYAPNSAPEKCSVCDLPFSSHFKGIPYCNKHYLRMRLNGTTELIGRKTNDYIIEGTTVEMTTNKGEVFFFDLPYLDKVKKYSWCVSATGYLVANINNKVTKLHRYILGLSDPTDIIDHINGDPMDNTISNLRVCTNTQNSRNTKLAVNNTTGYTGIRETPSGRYKARIMVNRREINLGTYDTFEQAKLARIEGEHKYFKDFAPSKGATSE